MAVYPNYPHFFNVPIEDYAINVDLDAQTLTLPRIAKTRLGESWVGYWERTKQTIERKIALHLWDGNDEDLTTQFWEIEIKPIPQPSTNPQYAYFDFTVTAKLDASIGENGEIEIVPF